MKQFLIVLLFVVVAVSVSGNEWFPITAWGIKHDSIADTWWVSDADTLWHANSTKICQRGGGVTEAFLNKGIGENDTFKFMISGLTTSGYVSLSNMARSQFSTYESEWRDDTYYPPGYFADSCVGEAVSDDSASNGTAWLADTASYDAGYMQMGLKKSGVRLRNKI